MRLKEEQIKRLAEKVRADLEKEGLITPRGEKSAIAGCISGTIGRDIAREQKLEKDAEKLLDETIAAMGRAGAEIDRRKMLKMVKEKLARERKVIVSDSEERISHLSHEITEQLWKDDLADFSDEGRALNCVKQTLASFYRVAGEIDEAVRAKLRNRAQGSRDWDVLYQKFYQEELVKRGL